MARITQEQLDNLTGAVRQQDYLVRLVQEVARLHRIVFHGMERANWQLVQQSAEQILIAEIVARHSGRAGGLLEALRTMERAGQPWDSAVREMASRVHSYYTTPLGVVIRQDLFGEQVVFFAPDAYEWTDQIKGHEEAGKSAE